MKILRIQFQNINSLRGEHQIDFSNGPLNSAGLFAITGPTGSGKTTLLDVISLALYDRVPRHNEKITKGFIEKTGSILTRNTEEAYAEVEYECPKGKYVSKWSISTARTGKLRDYDMELSEADTGKFIDLKKNDIPNKNEELIGLSYDQFIKSILLAQGEFSKFLKSKKDERGNLLEKITGTSIYRELGRLAFEKYKQFGHELDDLKKRESILLEEKLNPTEVDSLTKQIESIKTLLNTETEKHQGFQKQLELKEALNQLKVNIQSLEKEKTSLTHQLNSFTVEHGERLRKHEAILPFGELLNQWNSTQTEIEKTSTQSQELDRQQKSILEQIDSEIISIKTFIQKEVEATNAITEIERFTEEIEAFNQEIQQVRQDFSNALNLTKQHAKAIDFPISVKDQKLNQENLNRWIDKHDSELTAIKNEWKEEILKNPEQKIELNTQQIQNLRIATEQGKQLNRNKEEYIRVEKENQSITKRLDELPQQLISTSKDLKIIDLKLENLNQELKFRELSKSLEEHRSQLKDNEPCPLCGALEHPFATHFETKEDDLATAIATKTSERNALQAKVGQYKSEQDQLAKVKSNQDQQLTRLKDEIEAIQTKLKSLTSNISIEEIPTRIDQLEKESIQLNKFIELNTSRSVLEELKPLILELNQLHEKGTKLAEELKKKYAGKNIRQETDQIKQKWNQLVQSKSFLETQLKTANTHIGQLKEVLNSNENHLKGDLQALGYNSPKNALLDKLNENEFNQLKSRQNQLQTESNKIEVQLNTLTQQLEEKKKQEVEIELTKLKTAIHQHQANIDQHNNQLIELQAKSNRQASILLQLKTLKTEMDQQLSQNKKWMLLNKYIGDAQGKNFSTFAQELTLQQLVYLANKRLVGLTNRYQLDIPIANEDESLIIIDQHMGDMRRSVKTLSGGESFIMSLSLALALSDLASRNVEINSLFIDEGFGTLDPETLDQTLDTLEKLQAESNKTIGIISHVSALKERISTQIQISRNGQGNSSIAIRA